MPPFTSPAVFARLSSPVAASRNARLVLDRTQKHAMPHSLSMLRHSSMSAIVRGLRRSFRDPDGKRPPGRNEAVAAHVSERRRARVAAPETKFKILRGKKDVTEPAIPKAKTRRARFFDPEDEYGKKSLVYQAKTGALEAEVKALALKRQREKGETEGRDNNTGESQSSRWDSGRGSGGYDADRSRPRSRTAGDSASFGGRPRSRQGVTGRRDREAFQRDDRRSAGQVGRDRPVRRSSSEDRYERKSRRDDETYEDNSGDRDKHADWNSERTHDRKNSRGRGYVGHHEDTAIPLSIPYTTAASQFLYGRSVVEAALRSGRRQLYKLYVYGGANRSGAPRDLQVNQMLEQLAKRKNVKIEVVDERWQRLLDKMSKGRPHNGYILEASPLPQPPLTALGPFTEGTKDSTSNTASAEGESLPFATGPGFKIEAGYQSREEASVNGGSDFVPVQTPRIPAAPLEESAGQEKGAEGLDIADADAAPGGAAPRHYRPLVLLLDQVLDPGNLGAILRSANFLGVSAVVVSKHGSSTLTSVALKASAGASEAIALFSVDAPATFLAESRKAGWKVYAAVPLPAQGPGGGSYGNKGNSLVLDQDALEKADPLRKDPCILVMGSEGEGLSRAIRREADVEVSIANRSGSNVVDSLNVSVATGLLCASFLRGATRSSSGYDNYRHVSNRSIGNRNRNSITAPSPPIRENSSNGTSDTNQDDLVRALKTFSVGTEKKSKAKDDLNIWF